jgi:hypothetical protein
MYQRIDFRPCGKQRYDTGTIYHVAALCPGSHDGDVNAWLDVGLVPVAEDAVVPPQPSFGFFGERSTLDDAIREAYPGFAVASTATSTERPSYL